MSEEEEFEITPAGEDYLNNPDLWPDEEVEALNKMPHDERLKARAGAGVIVDLEGEGEQ